MLNLHIACLGKLKESYWNGAEQEYLKRMKPYAKITITELSEQPFRDVSEKKQIQKKEAETIKKYIKKNDITVALDEKGKHYSSKEFAAFVESLSSRGERITWIIGGPLGLDPSLIAKAHHVVSLSSLTFPHQMTRIILLEQLYRVATIIKNKPYHY